MKTLKTQYASLIVLVFLFTLNMKANTNTPNFPEEMYINDIPFDTEIVAENFSINQISMDFDFSDESELFDIPFNIACVTSNYRYELAMAQEFELEEEAYVNDIPFSTEKVTTRVNSVDFKDEANINDIPFDTFALAKKVYCHATAINN